MKSFLFVVCLALVQGAPSPDADADPALFYSTGYNYPHATYHHGGVHPAAIVPNVHAAFPHGGVTPVIHQAVVQNVEVTPVEVKSVVTPVTHTYASPYNFPLSYPYANGAYPYTTGAYPFSPYATALHANVATVSHDIAPGAPTYIANSGGAIHVVNKREAEAEADADPALFYSTGNNYPYAAATYRHGGVHPAAIVPSVHAAFPHGIVAPVVHQAVAQKVEVTPAEVKSVVTPVTHTYASPYNFPLSFPYSNVAYPYTTGAYPFSPYATAPLANLATVSRDIAPGAPSYIANSGGALHIVNKREADPEADADAYYGGYGYGNHYGYGHHLGYGRAYGYGRRAYSGYHGYPYGSYNRGIYGYHF